MVKRVGSPHMRLAFFRALQGGRVHLDQCDITSQSGDGVGVEGAAVQLTNCRVHDCERHGVAVFGSLEGEPAAHARILVPAAAAA